MLSLSKTLYLNLRKQYEANALMSTVFYKRRQQIAQSAVCTCTVSLTVQNQLQKSPTYSWLITLVLQPKGVKTNVPSRKCWQLMVRCFFKSTAKCVLKKTKCTKRKCEKVSKDKIYLLLWSTTGELSISQMCLTEEIGTSMGLGDSLTQTKKIKEMYEL